MAVVDGPVVADVVVVGAGVAGLACAHDLAAAGLGVTVLEADDAVGGRMRTDRLDGFTVDRGFQVVNPAYPQLRRRLPMRFVDPRPFLPGVLVHTGDRRVLLADPRRRPDTVAALLTGRFAGPRDLMALAALGARDALAPARTLTHAPEHTTRTALADAGFSEPFVADFFRPFLAGVFLEDTLETSSRVFHLVWRSMLRGALCLPAFGVQSVPRALAAALPEGTVRLGTPVSGLADRGVLMADGRELPARAVVVATGAGAAARLLPGLAVPAHRTVTTYYHVAPRSPLKKPVLLVDTRRRVLNTCVLSEVAPGYAPRGSALVATSVLGGDEGGVRSAVTTALSEMYDTDTTAWDLLTARTIEDALPAMPPPWPLTRTCRTGQRRYVCGDHRGTGSVQGALASGARAAREVLEDLGGK
ncbi:FAD-dependent oxidoreductase [Streptomyces lavendulae]|nr:NAD(P)/FAD-dependent oxidoreductase [Streptomyces lavendulae]TXJ86139.1 FAD-dependent oxidoreductase [Streptomyces lavendulae]